MKYWFTVKFIGANVCENRKYCVLAEESQVYSWAECHRQHIGYKEFKIQRQVGSIEMYKTDNDILVL